MNKMEEYDSGKLLECLSIWEATFKSFDANPENSRNKFDLIPSFLARNSAIKINDRRRFTYLYTPVSLYRV